MRSPGRGYGPPPPIDRPSRPYKVLCVSALHPKASDDVVRDTLYREYKKYGDISVRVIMEPDERVAYVYFRNFEDARDAKHSKSRIILFDKAAVVEPVYESRSEAPPPSYQPRRRSITPPPGPPGGGYPRYRSRSPGDYRGSSGSRDDYRGGYDNHDRGYVPRDHHGYPPRGDYQGGRGRGGYHPRGGYQHHQPHYQPHHDGPRGRYDDRNQGGYQKKEKFPNYLNHIPPEDDPLATRTLFAGNLELNITDEEMKRIFGRYGRLVDIDVKRPAPGTGNAYAFIRYENLDQAHRAKKELSGQYIGKFQCKIGYGKVNATTKVWVGGLGPWCSENVLWKEFDRFGSIKKIEFQKGDTQAHIFYEVIDAAQAAVSEMRGFPLGGPDKRIRIDYADLDVPTGLTSRRVDNHGAPPRGPPVDGRGPPGGYNGDKYGGPQQRYGGGGDSWGGSGGRRPDSADRMQGRPRRSDSPESGQDMSPRSRGQDLSSARNVNEIMGQTPKVWDGGLILKNSLFPTKLHLIEGNRRIAEVGLKDEEGRTNLKITQRLRLDQGKLEDVSKRMSNASSYAVFLGVTTNVNIQHDNPEVQSRPLRNLISYLKQKEAAGVISMNYKEDSEMTQGVLYCFPPCAYSMDLLRREAPNVIDESNKDDHLLVVVVCGSHN